MSEPSSVWMKPKPLSPTSFLIVPFATCPPRAGHVRGVVLRNCSRSTEGGTRTIQVPAGGVSVTRPSVRGGRGCRHLRGNEKNGRRARQGSGNATATDPVLAEGARGAPHRGGRADRPRQRRLDAQHPERPHLAWRDEHSATFHLNRQRDRRVPAEPP